MKISLLITIIVGIAVLFIACILYFLASKNMDGSDVLWSEYHYCGGREFKFEYRKKGHQLQERIRILKTIFADNFSYPTETVGESYFDLSLAHCESGITHLCDNPSGILFAEYKDSKMTTIFFLNDNGILVKAGSLKDDLPYQGFFPNFLFQETASLSFPDYMTYNDLYSYYVINYSILNYYQNGVNTGIKLYKLENINSNLAKHDTVPSIYYQSLDIFNDERNKLFQNPETYLKEWIPTLELTFENDLYLIKKVNNIWDVQQQLLRQSMLEIFDLPRYL